MNMIQPKDKLSLDARDAMLRETLRPDTSPWPIAAEYPIVLDHADPSASFCVMLDDAIAAHANFWPRVLVNATGETVGRCALIGNVATSPRFRGRGTTRPLFETFNRLAAEQTIDLMVLWAEPDLHPFYQKSGFRSFGREWRYSFLHKDLEAYSASHTGQFLPYPRPPEGYPREFLGKLLAMRPRGLTLGRTVAEFDRLLTIPDTLLFVSGSLKSPTGYGICGRGCDMRETIHEWGVADPAQLLTLLADIVKDIPVTGATLMAPGTMDSSWRKELARIAFRSETHELCMAKGPEKTLDQFGDLFIWGMDSI